MREVAVLCLHRDILLPRSGQTRAASACRLGGCAGHHNRLIFPFCFSIFCTGEKGSSGLLGFPGMPGLPGVPGLNGFKGAPGTAGGKGSPGVVGLQGQKGEKLLKGSCWLCSRGA